jgi:hypothetical protein
MAAHFGSESGDSMIAASRENKNFVRLVEALSPWLGQVVIIGGWAHRLYRLHPLSQHLDFAPLTTLDTDIAVPERLEVHEEDVHTRLTANGFTEELFGEDQPPATHYTLGKDGAGFYAEFVTPLIGGLDNRGKPISTVSVAGVTSQKLRYLELLLNAPWQVILDHFAGFPLKGPTAVQIPNAASYLAQKLLIHNKREPQERAKDIVYIHDTIQTFGRSLPSLQQEWIDNVKRLLSAKAATKVSASAEELFGKITDSIRDAAIVASATGRSILPEEIRAACYSGLKQIFS